MKYRSSTPDKAKCPKLFEVDDQINPIFQIYDEPAEGRRNSFDGPADGQFFENVCCLRFPSLNDYKHVLLQVLVYT